MAKITKHGVLDIDYQAIMDIVTQSNHEKSSVYDRPDYIRTRTGDQKQITEKCADWYKHSSFSYKIKNDAFKSLIPEDFYSRFGMKKDPVDISLDMLGTVKEKVKKLWVALSHPEFGHAFFVGDEVVYNVPRGTVIETDFISDWHSGVNAGITDRYILTIMGVKNG
jgi:hypothetical protein